MTKIPPRAWKKSASKCAATKRVAKPEGGHKLSVEAVPSASALVASAAERRTASAAAPKRRLDKPSSARKRLEQLTCAMPQRRD
jgi:hypothetical protein